MRIKNEEQISEVGALKLTIERNSGSKESKS